MTRSVNTHVTVTLALLAMYFFGGHAIHSFTATMLFGVVLVGTYTSVFIAAPLLIYFGVGSFRASTDRGRAGARARGGAQAGLSLAAEPRHLPYPAPIEAYGKGGFRFAGMSHRGSLLCLPDGIWPWPVAQAVRDHRGRAGAGVCAGREIDLLLIGTGRGGLDHAAAAAGALPARSTIAVEATNTGSAVSTYNILFGEGRRVAAGLIADE